MENGYHVKNAEGKKVQEYIPAILTFVGVALTVIVNLGLGIIKQKTDIKTVDISAESTFRDDLLEQLEAKNKREEALLQRISERDATIDRNLKDIFDKEKLITQLEIDKHRLQRQTDDLQTELDKFNRKVYYIRKIAEDNSGDTK